MTESKEGTNIESPPLDGGESSNKTSHSVEEATVDGSASELSPPTTATESSPEEIRNDDNQTEALIEAGKKESKEGKEDGPTTAVKLDAHKPETSPVETNSNNDVSKSETAGKDVKAPKNGDTASSKQENQSPATGPVVSSTKRTRPPYKYDPEKVTLRFLFANKDGLTVTVECKPSDTVGEVKGQLLSVWPDDLPDCSGGDQLRLICMGKGMLMPDTRTLEDCQVPVFKTHPTPVNVSVRPKTTGVESTKAGKDGGIRGTASPSPASGRTPDETGQGCGCIIQ